MSSKLSIAVSAYRKANLPSLIRGQCDCHLNDRDIISQLIDADMISAKMDTACASHQFTGVESQLTFFIPKFFVENFDSYLTISSSRTEIPVEFYIADIDYYYPEDKNIPPIVQAYFNAVNLIGFIEQCSDYCDEDSDTHTLVFLCSKNGKLQLLLEYNVLSLENSSINEEQLNFLEECLSNGEKHRQQIRYMIKDSLFSMLKAIDEGNRLSYLFASFSMFIQSVRCHYELFLSGLDYHEIVKTFDKEKIDYFSSIGKVYSDLYNKLFAIPLALIFAATSFNYIDKFDTKNKIIACSAILFLGLMSLLVLSNKRTLGSIKSDYVNRFDHYAKYYPNVYQYILPLKEELDIQIAHQLLHLRIITIVVCSLLVVSFFVFILSFPFCADLMQYLFIMLLT